MGGYQLEEIFSFRNVVTYALICMLIYELLWLFLVVMDLRKQIGIAARMAFGKAIEIVKGVWQSKR